MAAATLALRALLGTTAVRLACGGGETPWPAEGGVAGAEQGAEWSPAGVLACVVAAAMLLSVPCACLVPHCMPGLGLPSPREFLAAARVQAVPCPGAPAVGLLECHEYVRGEVLLTQALPYVAAAAAAAACACLGAGAVAPVSGTLTVLVILRAVALDLLLSKGPRLGHVPLRDGEREEEQGPSRPLASKSSPPLVEVAWTSVLSSKFEVMDAITDGVALVTVFLQEHGSASFHERLVLAWAHGAGPAPLLAPAIGQFGLSGLMTVSLLCATLAQLSAAIIWLGNGAICADLAGLGGAQERLTLPDETPAAKAMRRALPDIARAVAEGLPQMLLQASALSAQGVSLRSQPALAASLALSLWGSAQKAAELLQVAWRSALPLPGGAGWRGSPLAMLIGFSYALPGLALLGACSYFAVKVVMIDRCPQHAWACAWPLDAGCLDFGGP